MGGVGVEHRGWDDEVEDGRALVIGVGGRGGEVKYVDERLFVGTLSLSF